MISEKLETVLGEEMTCLFIESQNL